VIAEYSASRLGLAPEPTRRRAPMLFPMPAAGAGVDGGAPLDDRRRRDDGAGSTWEIVLRSIALAAVALSLGIAASFLVETHDTGYLGGRHAAR